MIGFGGPPVPPVGNECDDSLISGGTVSANYQNRTPAPSDPGQIAEDAAIARRLPVETNLSMVPKTAEERIRAWFIRPIETLQQVCPQDGGFAVLMLSIPLYERLARIELQKENPGINLGRNQVGKYGGQLAADMALDTLLCKAFWKHVRHGVVHTGMPFTEPAVKWRLDGTAPRPIQWEDENTRTTILVQPWSFSGRVVQLWKDNMHLAKEDGGSPLGYVSFDQG